MEQYTLLYINFQTSINTYQERCNGIHIVFLNACRLCFISKAVRIGVSWRKVLNVFYVFKQGKNYIYLYSLYLPLSCLYLVCREALDHVPTKEMNRSLWEDSTWLEAYSGDGFFEGDGGFSSFKEVVLHSLLKRDLIETEKHGQINSQFFYLFITKYHPKYFLVVQKPRINNHPDFFIFMSQERPFYY